MFFVSSQARKPSCRLLLVSWCPGSSTGLDFEDRNVLLGQQIGKGLEWLKSCPQLILLQIQDWSMWAKCLKTRPPNAQLSLEAGPWEFRTLGTWSPCSPEGLWGLSEWWVMVSDSLKPPATRKACRRIGLSFNSFKSVYWFLLLSGLSLCGHFPFPTPCLIRIGDCSPERSWDNASLAVLSHFNPRVPNWTLFKWKGFASQ